MPDNQFLPPIEIPWHLAGTTRALNLEPKGGIEQRGATVSLFTYYPDLKQYENDYPDDYLIYLKFSVSISPSVRGFFSEDSALKREFFGNLFVTPVKRVLLDLKVQRSEGASTGDITPYFFDAAPRYRSAVETGVVGGQQSSKSSSALAVGKSASSLHESYNSSSQATTSGSGGSASIGIPGIFSIGGSASTNTTTSTVNGSRDVTQGVDVTNRQAAEERRELTSYMTSIENVLTLLTTHNIGSPYLRFSLWPAPLHQPVVNVSDPYEWYASLSRHRSSGIEGVQDFFAVMVVPRVVEKVCIEAKLKTVCVPQPLSSIKFDGPPVRKVTPTEQAKIISYLTRRYPRGTPIDDLDVDFMGRLPNPSELQEQRQLLFQQSVVDYWHYSEDKEHINGDNFDLIWLQYYSMKLKGSGQIRYKIATEVWLEMLREEHQAKMLSNPFKMGEIFVLDTNLECCIPTDSGSKKQVDVKHSVSPMRLLRKDAWRSTGRTTANRAGARAGASRVSDTIHQSILDWNTADAQLTNFLISEEELPTSEVTLDDPAILEMIFNALAEVDEDHPSNVPIMEATAFGISARRIGELQRKGINTVRELAESIINAPFIERYNVQIERTREAGERARVAEREREQAGGEARPQPNRPSLGDEIRADLDLQPLAISLTSEEARQLTPAIAEIVQRRVRSR